MSTPIYGHKKRKDNLETGAVLLFLLELEISGVAVLGIHQNSKKLLLSMRIFLSGDDFKVVLAVFCCYDKNANASEAVEIATDEKNYQKCSLCVIV